MGWEQRSTAHDGGDQGLGRRADRQATTTTKTHDLGTCRGRRGAGEMGGGEQKKIAAIDEQRVGDRDKKNPAKMHQQRDPATSAQSDAIDGGEPGRGRTTKGI